MGRLHYDLMCPYSPNLSKFLSKNPQWSKMSRTDYGNYYIYDSYPASEEIFYEKGSGLCGFVMRKDWLDDLRLQPPETIEEWYHVLKAFREEKCTKAPLSYKMMDDFEYKGLIGAYGIEANFYQVDGKVMFGRVLPQYREYLKETLIFILKHLMRWE